MKMAIVLVIGLLALGACGVQKDVGNDKGTFIDGEMTDITNRNPNFLDLNTGEGNFNNRRVYLQKVRRAVADSKTFTPKTIYLNGHTVTVNVTAKGKYDQKDLAHLENQLIQEVPRFKYKIKVRDS